MNGIIKNGIIRNGQIKNKKSEILTDKLRKDLSIWVTAQKKMGDTNEMVGNKLGISRLTLERVTILGSAKPETVATIKKIIKSK